MAPILLKTKGGKHFGALASLSDADSLQLTWKVSSKVAAHLEQGERIENLSWRLWHIRDLMVGDEAETSSRGAARSACTESTHSRSCSTSGHCAEERAFNKLSASVATKLESEKRLPVGDLSAPTFRWTDTSDTIRYRGVMRSHRREQTRPLNFYNSPTRLSITSCPTADQECSREGNVGTVNQAERTTASLAHSRRRKRRQSDDGDSSAGSSSPSASSSSPITFFSGKVTPESRLETRRATPPVCWRLTKEKAACQKGARQRSDQHHERRVQDAPQDLDSRSAWTLQQIEDAERELQEQGVELSGPFVAMLADLKAGGLARVKGFMSDACNSATTSGKQDEHNYPYKEQNATSTSKVVTSPIARVNEDIHSDLEENEEIKRATDTPSSPTTPTLNPDCNSVTERRQKAAKDMPAGSTASKPTLSDSGRDNILDNTNADAEETASVKIQDSTEQIHSDASAHEQKPREKPQCTNCGATSTPLWRRDANFELQCNACGLYEKLHKAPRPRSLKQRRSDRRIGKDSPGEGQSSHRSSLSPDEVAPSGRDEWIGIHAGSICANCGTSTTPLWRKDREGRIICNACGLYYKLHNAHRPTTMRMDAIKRRSRYDDRRRTATLSTDTSTHGHRTPVAGEDDGGDMAPMFPGFALPPPIHVAGPGAGSLPQYSNLPPQTAFGPGAPFMGAQGPPMVPMPAQQHPHDYQPGRAPPFRHMPSNGAQHMMGPHAGIHIPAALWEHQVCPMGAWGENCCQNLPQPPPDIQSALMVSDNVAPPSSGPPHGAEGGITDNGREQGSEALSVTAAMDAILGSNDWMLDFGCGTGLPEDIIMSNLNESAPNGPGSSANPRHFDPSAVSGASDASIVGPTLPLRRRKDTSSQPKKVNEGSDPGASNSANETMQPVLHTTPSAGSLHAATPSSDMAQSLPGASVGDAQPDGMQNVSAGTQATWWPFASSPEAVR